MFSLSRRNLVIGGMALLVPIKTFASGHNPLCRYRDNGGIFLPERRILVAGSDYPTHQAMALSHGQPVTVSAENHFQYIRAFTDIRSGRLPTKSVVLFDVSDNPEPSIARMDKTFGRVLFLHNVPKTREALSNIHGPENFSAGALDLCQTLA
jgi:hypothetical protein